MQQINFKKFKYWQLQYELIHDKGLTYQQGAVYAYLYNHCVNINQNGYCGYSDERMADDMKLHYRTFKRELKVLKDKGLILTVNPNKRTKKTGESRMICINSENYLVEVQMSLADIQNANLKRENEKLKAKIAELEKNALDQGIEEITPTMWGVKLYKSGFMTPNEYMEHCDFYNELLRYFVHQTDYRWYERAIKYFAKQVKGKTINNRPAYLEKCVKDSILSFQIELKKEELKLDGNRLFSEYD